MALPAGVVVSIPLLMQGKVDAEGAFESILPTFIYVVQNHPPAGGHEQFWLVPVDKNGKENGPIALKTSGRSMARIWYESSISNELFSYDFYPD